MREPIDVDPDVFGAASKVFGVDIHGPLVTARTGLESGLSGSGGMAGTDPAGSQWASSYDGAADTVHSLVGDLGNAAITLAALLQRTGFNHGMAESASDPTRSVPTPPDDTRYTPDPSDVPGLPSAHGSSSGPPALWWLVQHTVGYVWPNGDPGKLRSAANAWSTAGNAVGATTSFISEALSAIATQQSLETSDAFTVCESMADHINDVASACQQLAKACTDFANGVDKAHHDIESELESLAEWTAGIEAGGFLVGLITAGGGELGAQGVEAARVAATASRIGRIIQALIDLAGVVARTVANVITDVAQAAERLKVILGARLSRAITELVARLPGVGGDAADAAFNQISAWSLKWSQRGLEIEAKLGGNLPRSFPTIDKWGNGVATSIKSVDLSAATYQNTGALESKIRGYVDTMAAFKGASFDGVAVRLRDIRARALEVAIQPGVATAAQKAVLKQVTKYATSKGVQLTVVEVP